MVSDLWRLVKPGIINFVQSCWQPNLGKLVLVPGLLDVVDQKQF